MEFLTSRVRSVSSISRDHENRHDDGCVSITTRLGELDDGKLGDHAAHEFSVEHRYAGWDDRFHATIPRNDDSDPHLTAAIAISL